jgi:hypothetical protein
MGYMIAWGTCYACGHLFSFNPDTVLSVRVDGRREPICAYCMAIVNERKRQLGMPEIVIPKDAYEPTECL